MKRLTILLFALFVLLTGLSATAQKLPNVQKASLRAPANLKIDGKANEWDNQFEAYNKNTDIYYTLANDDEKIYLTVRAKDEIIINKILMGGITFTINRTAKKFDKDIAAVTFPLVDIADDLGIRLKNIPGILTDTGKSSLRRDTLLRLKNKNLAKKSNLIGLRGLNSITDSAISIYNDEEIRASSLLAGKITYTYELAVPLKYLGLALNTAPKFYYNIKLNGASTENAQVMTLRTGKVLVRIAGKASLEIIENANILGYPTDFWGEYTLLNK